MSDFRVAEATFWLLQPFTFSVQRSVRFEKMHVIKYALLYCGSCELKIQNRNIPLPISIPLRARPSIRAIPLQL